MPFECSLSHPIKTNIWGWGNLTFLKLLFRSPINFSERSREAFGNLSVNALQIACEHGRIDHFKLILEDSHAKNYDINEQGANHVLHALVDHCSTGMYCEGDDDWKCDAFMSIRYVLGKLAVNNLSS